MRLAFIDNSNQVMAVQDSPEPPNTTDWESVHGYTRIVVPDGMPVTRDYKLTHSNGEATGSTVNVNPVQPFVSYAEQRLGDYGSVEDQLDMLFWDMENGTTVWQDHVRDVKSRNPKP